jgi:hypothetical protein
MSESDSPQPVAWVAFAADGSESSAVYMTDGEARAAADEWNWCIAPLYRSPALTDAERVALYWALATLETEPDALNAEAAATLRGLLERMK